VSGPLRATMHRRSCSKDDLEVRMLSVLACAKRAEPKLVAISIPAPLLRPDQAFDCACQAPCYCFATGDKQGDVGLGTAVSLNSASIHSIGEIEQSADDLLQHCFHAGLDAAARPHRFYGGFSFDDIRSPNGPWRHFPRVWFKLPRFRYQTDGRIAELTLFVRNEEIRTPDEQLSFVRATFDTLAALDRRPSLPTRSPVVTARTDTPERKQWIRLVEKARDQLAKTGLEKVVLAREIALNFATAPTASNILSRLSDLAPETTRFALCQGPATFLGATPERLVFRLGSEIRTEALAGSIRASDAGAAEHLIGSEKERHEHQLVVSEIVSKLHSLGARADYSPRPQIRQLRHVLHLSTPIIARLFGPPHVLSIAARLHPTPAVGGVPETDALQFIQQHEGFERGFYAGAVGWFDAFGDGEFLVALRSGLLDENVFRLYAGAGIVPNSDPEREYDETELKFENLLEAIGVEPNSTSDRFRRGIDAT